MQLRQSSKPLPVVLAVLVLVVAGLSGLLWAQASAQPESDKPAAPEAAKPEQPRIGDVLLRENTRLIDRTGRILCLRDDLGIGNVARSVFQPKGELGHFILLENGFLEKLEAQTRHGERDVKISGTVTEYRGRNYLLLTRVFVRRD